MQTLAHEGLSSTYVTEWWFYTLTGTALEQCCSAELSDRVVSTNLNIHRVRAAAE